jgi:hypothetical protein
LLQLAGFFKYGWPSSVSSSDLVLYTVSSNREQRNGTSGTVAVIEVTMKVWAMELLIKLEGEYPGRCLMARYRQFLVENIENFDRYTGATSYFLFSVPTEKTHI